MHKLLYLLPLLATACHAPGVVVASPFIDEVKAALGSTREEAPRLVRGDAPMMDSGAFAACYDTHIVIMDVDPHVFDYFLAHELVHWYIVSTPFDNLPHFIEEGLADYLAFDVIGHLNFRKATIAKYGTVGISIEHMDLTPEEWSALPRELNVSTSHAGFNLVDRLGMERLRELAAEDVPPLAYFHAAGIGGVTCKAQECSTCTH